jgi:hypothetical protein
MFLLDLNKLCTDSHIISKEKGWLDTERSYAGLTDLMHSELAEALEDYRNNRPLDEIYYEAVLKGENGEENKKVILQSGELLGKSYVGQPKPCGIPVELADFVIRLAQHCGTEGWDLAGVVEYKNSLTRRLGWGDFEEMLAWAHTFISRSFLASKEQRLMSVSGLAASNTTNEALTELANAYLVIYDFCAAPVGPNKPRIDLPKAIAEKEAYNRTRPHRHGGKKI